jgi:hypothetical protein
MVGMMRTARKAASSVMRNSTPGLDQKIRATQKTIRAPPPRAVASNVLSPSRRRVIPPRTRMAPHSCVPSVSLPAPAAPSKPLVPSPDPTRRSAPLQSCEPSQQSQGLRLLLYPLEPGINVGEAPKALGLLGNPQLSANPSPPAPAPPHSRKPDSPPRAIASTVPSPSRRRVIPPRKTIRDTHSRETIRDTHSCDPGRPPIEKWVSRICWCPSKSGCLGFVDSHPAIRPRHRRWHAFSERPPHRQNVVLPQDF